MNTFDFGAVAGLGTAAALLFLLAWAWAYSRRRAMKGPLQGPLQGRVQGEAQGSAQGGETPVPGIHVAETGGRRSRSEERLAALETLQAGLAARIDALVSAQNEPEERLQALASQILSLIRDKNATFDTALAGLDQLRARMRTLEQVGDLAETRQLIDEVTSRLEGLQTSQSAEMAALVRRIDMLETPGQNPFAEISAQLTQLYAQKDDAVETMLNRVGPLETRLAEIGSRDGDLARMETSLEALQEAQDEQRNALATLCAGVTDTQALADGIAALRNQKAEIAQNLGARLDMIERQMAQQDPQALLERFNDRLESLREIHAASETGMKDRLAALETPGESPFAAISEQLTQLYAQKDATVEAVFARLAPLEAKLDALENGFEKQDPKAVLDLFSQRFESLRERVTALEAPGESPFAEISEQLTRLYAQKDTAVETVLARLAPLETKLSELEGGLAAQDPRTILDRFSERLVALETPRESPFAEISEQLTRLYAQKDATVETVFARLAPLEAKFETLDELLSEIDSREGAMALQEQVRELAGRQRSTEAAVQAKLEALTETQAATRSDFAALRAETVSIDIIAQRLEGLHAQKDALSEVLMSRMRQLEAAVAANDPGTMLDNFSARLESLKERIAALETPGESPFAAISEQLTRLYAQKDATVEAVFARLTPLEAKLDAFENGLGAAARLDQMEELTARLEALDWAQDALVDRLGGVEATAGEAAAKEVSRRLVPVETKLSVLEGGLAAQDPRAALDRFAARLEALKDRIVALETPGESPFAAISEQLTRLYAQKDATVETVFARLAPLEAKLDVIEGGLGAAAPRDQLEGLTARLDALDWVQDELADRLGGMRATAEDTATKLLSGQLAPLQARLAEMEGTLAAQDPRGALDRFSERLEALKDRLIALETPDESPLAAISEQLSELYAEKDATAETMAARLAPLEAKLAALETGLGAAAPRDQLEGLTARLTARLDALADAQEVVSERLTSVGTKAEAAVPMAEIRKTLAEAFAGRDANVEALLKRLAPLEERLAEIEARPWDPDADAARAQAQEVAMQMIAARAAAEHTEFFADRLALLETTLPRLSATQTILMQSLESRASGMAGQIAAALHADPAQPSARSDAPAEGRVAKPDDLGAVHAMPRVISLHQR
jgi:hypothetical protein